MKRLTGCEHIELPRQRVFEAGIQAATWPKDLEGLRVTPEAEALTLGGLVRIGVVIAGFRENIRSEVTQLTDAEAIIIEGESKLSAVKIAFTLEDTKQMPGTDVAYNIEMCVKGLAGRLAEPAVFGLVQSLVPEFTAQYRENVLQYAMGSAVAQA